MSAPLRLTDEFLAEVESAASCGDESSRDVIKVIAEARRARAEEERLAAQNERLRSELLRVAKDSFPGGIPLGKGAKWGVPSDIMVDKVTREITRLRSSNAALVEALRFQDPRNATERYDLIAEDFHRATGLMAPGKSVPAAMGAYSPEEEERRNREWRPFVNSWHERWFDAAIEQAEKDGGT